MVVAMYVQFPVSLRNVEYLLFERGIDDAYEKVRFLWNRFPTWSNPVIILSAPPIASSERAEREHLPIAQLQVAGRLQRYAFWSPLY